MQTNTAELDWSTPMRDKLSALVNNATGAHVLHTITGTACRHTTSPVPAPGVRVVTMVTAPSWAQSSEWGQVQTEWVTTRQSGGTRRYTADQKRSHCWSQGKPSGTEKTVQCARGLIKVTMQGKTDTISLKELFIVMKLSGKLGWLCFFFFLFFFKPATEIALVKISK